MSDRDIWEQASWASRRSKYSSYRNWYKGIPLKETMDQFDSSSGEPVRKFPLEINLPKLACDLHRDISRGIPDSKAPLIVQAIVEREMDNAEGAESVINDVWRVSYGADLQQRSLLDMNIYGGTALSLKWEPWNRDLPYRFAVRKMRDPGTIKPVWSSSYDPWRMIECYIGFMISREEAVGKWGVKVPDFDDEVLYLEYWSEKEWWIRVHDQTPTMSWNNMKWSLRGENTLGFVPIYYIPHERTTELFGESQIEGQKELTRDFNSRVANVSDIMASTRAGLLVGSDISRTPEVKNVKKGDKVVANYIDIGETRGLQGSNPPSLQSLPIPDVSSSLLGFPDELLNWWMMVSRISPTSFGLDDTSSGRITGPTTAQRMWTSISHSATERVNFNTGKCLIDKDIISAVQSKSDAYRELGINVPDLSTIDPPSMRIKQRWPSMIPLDRQQRHEELLGELREGGSSIERYLRARGVEDVEAEKKRIIEWLTEVARIENKNNEGFPE